MQSRGQGGEGPTEEPRSQEPVARPAAPELERILGVRHPVLDDGFVRVVDYMGSDAAIVQAARVSYGAGTKQVREDRALIRYLMRHLHTTPFEMCEIKLHVRVPMDAWRQWIRHRTASVNEYSTRYSVAIDAAQTTPPNKWRTQASTNRQGSGECLPEEVGRHLTSRESELQALARKVYEERLAAGVAREQARKDLPLSTYTEAYWKIDLHNLLHFLALRMDAHAQEEIRSYALIIGFSIVACWCPAAWESFLEYRFNGLQFSKCEAEILAHLIQNRREEAHSLAVSVGLIRMAGAAEKPTRELAEFETKLERIGLTFRAP